MADKEFKHLQWNKVSKSCVFTVFGTAACNFGDFSDCDWEKFSIAQYYADLNWMLDLTN